MDCLNKFDDECYVFHEKMMNEGVKAYRCNDGWVDREKHNITFFSSDRHYGYYWGNLSLNTGDKIFIGNAHDGGKYAIIEHQIYRMNHSARYHYKILEEPVKKRIRFKNNGITKFILNILVFIGALYGVVITLFMLPLYLILSIPLLPFQLTAKFKLKDSETWCITKFITNIIDKAEELI